jgi:hypothetical protein
MAVTHLAASVSTPRATDEPTSLSAPAAATGAASPARSSLLEAGDKVEVRRRLDDKWARGFEVLAVTGSGYRLRRLSDGVELPTTFAVTDVRKERKRSTWWY